MPWIQILKHSTARIWRPNFLIFQRWIIQFSYIVNNFWFYDFLKTKTHKKCSKTRFILQGLDYLVACSEGKSILKQDNKMSSMQLFLVFTCLVLRSPLFLNLPVHLIIFIVCNIFVYWKCSLITSILISCFKLFNSLINILYCFFNFLFCWKMLLIISMPLFIFSNNSFYKCEYIFCFYLHLIFLYTLTTTS